MRCPVWTATPCTTQAPSTGLAGLVADIFMAEVADGVTFIPASPEQDMRELADAALDRIARRLPLSGAA